MTEVSNTNDTQAKKWYVLRVVNGQEKKIKQYVESEVTRLGLQDFVSQVLIPMEKVIQIRNGKKVAKERNIYPGYVMLEGILVGEIPHVLKNITGVIGFLGSKTGDPVPLRDHEVKRMLGTVDELTGAEETMLNTYVVGETVKVIDGPFNTFSGVIEEINEEKKKLKVMVKIFGRKTPLELSYMQVEKE
jgi:transcriptional antiterminator NusG